MPYETRYFCVFNKNEVSKVNFNEVLESDADELTIRPSIHDLTFVTWDGVTPTFITSLESTIGVFPYSEVEICLEVSPWHSLKSYMLTYP